MSKKLKILEKNIKRKINNKKNNQSNKTNPTNKKRKVSTRKVLKFLILAFFIMCICGLFMLGLFFGYIVIKAPTFSAEQLYNKQPSVLVAKDGTTEFARIGSEIRDIISYDQLPETLVDAIVATEDSRFFQHNGFDLPRFTIATVKQLLGNSAAGGASTLTMQISKNKLTSKEDSGIKGIIRKFTDIYMAIFKIEKTYTKQEIIEFYVNSNYLGGDANGVEDASKVYFGKSAKDLTLSEAAMIAGLFNAPGYYDPYIRPEACEQRRQTVLYLMKRHGYITEEEYNVAIKLSVDKIVRKQEKKEGTNYQGFINTVVEEVLAKTGNNPYDVPMRIYTTMEVSQQEHMDKLMNGQLDSYKWQNDKVQGGVAVVATDGSITAIGAGRNRTERDYNYATMLNNQIGSTAKPLYDYALGIEYKNWSTYQIFVDEPWGYSDGTSIKNWDLKYEGFVTMRKALIDSRNIPALKAFQATDNKTRVEWIKNLGLHPEMADGIIHEAHALGGYNGESPLSMAAAYNAFANGGYYIEPYSFTKIEYLENKDTYEYKYTMKKVMSEETAYMMTNLLISVARGTGFSGYYVNGVTYAGKSGTTNLDQVTIDKWGLPSRAVADIWAVGYTNKYTIAARYGYDEMSSEYYNTFGSGQNYRLFANAARGVFTEKSEFTKPEGVIAVEVELGCYDACLPSEFTPAHMRTTEYFKKGFEPTTVSDRYNKLSDVTGLNATVKGSSVTLTWDKIKTPNAINLDHLKSYFGAVYKNADWGVSAATSRYNDNISSLGTIVYKVYEQTDSGLTLVGTTADGSIKISANSSNPTYIVKTSYTNFVSNMSNGSSISVKGASVDNTLVAIPTSNIIEVNKADTKISDETKIATVTNNGINVDNSKVTYSYKLDTTKNSGETYSLSVKVYYDKTLVDTITIKIKVK